MVKTLTDVRGREGVVKRGERWQLESLTEKRVATPFLE